MSKHMQTEDGLSASASKRGTAARFDPVRLAGPGVTILDRERLRAAVERRPARALLPGHVPDNVKVASVDHAAARLQHGIVPADTMMTYPFSSIGRVMARRKSGGVFEGVCTGVLVGPKLVLTATHLLRDRPLSDWVFQFVPGYHDGERVAAPDGHSRGSSLFTGAVVHGNPTGSVHGSGPTEIVNGFDFSIFELVHRLGDHWGHLGTITANGSFYENRAWQSVGYPVGLHGGRFPIKSPIDVDDVESDDYGSREIETESLIGGSILGPGVHWDGWSGGPLITFYNGAWWVGGVLSGWDLDGFAFPGIPDLNGVHVFSGGPRLGVVMDEAYQRFDPPAPAPIPAPARAPMVFYNQADGQWATSTVQADGSLDTVFVSDPGSMGAWTHIAGAGNGALVFYNRANGQWATSTLQADGSLDTVFVSDPGSMGAWTHIAGAGNGALVFYNQANGQWATSTLQADGSLDTVFVSDPGSMGAWTHIAGAGNGALVFYNQANGQWATSTLQADGSLDTVFVSDPGSMGAWTHIAGAGNGALVFYNQANGQWATSTLQADGSLDTVFVSDPGSMGAWTHIAGAGNGALVFYNRANGQWATSTLQADGSLDTVFVSDPGSMGAWTHIAGAGNG